ncbi:MAG: gliding motility-associated C-terminal domain-containing protein [Bacteroidetes bacterium]|nr:gliding motility-associated C-terminal domain-containing protein [Bacteroidota bacterium]
MIDKHIKIIAIGIFILLLFINCNRIKFNRNCCQDGRLEVSVDSSVLALPNAFTPNGDGINDVLYILGNNLSSISFKIKDGMKTVFETTDINEGWDGSFKGRQKQKTYSFNLDAITTSGEELSLKGSVCALICVYSSTDISGCCFHAQWTNNSFDPTLPTGESLLPCN